jgi:hypothetical protein
MDSRERAWPDGDREHYRGLTVPRRGVAMKGGFQRL